MKATRLARLSDARVRCMLPSPDGVLVASNCGDRFVHFFDTRSGLLVATVAFRASIVSMCWVKTFDSLQSLACLCSDGNLRVRKLDSDYRPTPNARQTVICAKDGDLTEGGLAFHAEGNQLAIGFPGNITVWSLAEKGGGIDLTGYHDNWTRERPYTYGCADAEWVVAERQSDVFMIGSGIDGAAKKYLAYTPQTARRACIRQFLSARRLLVFFTQPGHVVEHDLKTNTIISQARLCSSIASVAFLVPDAVAIDDEEFGLRIFRLASEPELSNLQTSTSRTLRGPRPAGSSTCLVFIRDNLLVSGAEGEELWVWNIQTGRCYGSLSTRDVSTDGQLSTIALLFSHQCSLIGDGWDVGIALGGPTGLRVVTVRFSEDQEEAAKKSDYGGHVGRIGISTLHSQAIYDPSGASLESVFVRVLNFALLLGILSILCRDYGFETR